MTQAAALQPEAALAAPPAEDGLYEIVNGQRVELPPMSAYEVQIASFLVVNLGVFANEHQLGRVVGEMLFALRAEQGLQRRPDVAFVSYQKWPRGRAVPRTNAWEVVPDLAIEVVSPTNFAEEVVTRVLDFFQAGTAQVWVVFPAVRQVYVYQSPTQVQILTRDGELDGGPVLPGFRLPVAALFEDESATA
jgi:Uma2 family endonuclease